MAESSRDAEVQEGSSCEEGVGRSEEEKPAAEPVAEEEQPACDGHQLELDVTRDSGPSESGEPSEVTYVPYESELQMPDITRLMKADLSEPYSIYTYRYFIHNWPKLCILVSCVHGTLVPW